MFLFLSSSLPGQTPLKKKTPPTFFPVVPQPEKKMQSVAPVKTPQPLPLKVPLEEPSPTGARQVSVGGPVTCPESVDFLCYLAREMRWSAFSSSSFTCWFTSLVKFYPFKKIYKSWIGLGFPSNI